MKVLMVVERGEGRLCGDCFKKIPVGSEVKDFGGRHYHQGCEVGKSDYEKKLEKHLRSHLRKKIGGR